MAFDLLAAVQVFTAVIDAGSLTRGAERIGMSVSAVSHALTRLEKHLSTKLVHRDSRSLEVTQAGESFLVHARRIIGVIDEATDSLKPQGDAVEGRMLIGMPVGFGTKVLIPHLSGFVARHPKLQLELHMSDRFAHLDREGLDLAVRIGPQRDERAVYKLLGHLPVVYVASPAYIAAHGEPRSLLDLAGHKFVNHKFPESGRTLPHVTGTADGFVETPIDASMLCTSDLALEAAALGGLGIAPVLGNCVRRELEAGTLVRVMPGAHTMSPPLWIAYPTRSIGNPKVKAFAEFLQGLIASDLVSLHPQAAGTSDEVSLLALRH